MAYILGALFALACVAAWEAFSGLEFLELVKDVVGWLIIFLISPFVILWVMFRLVFKGVSHAQYKSFVCAPGTETKQLIGQIYYAHDPDGSRPWKRHFFLRLRKG